MRPSHPLVAPLLGTGLLLGAYLLLRPYGDAAEPTGAAAAAAFASPRWVLAHLLGALGLVSVARLCLRLAEELPGSLTRVARTTGLAGAVLVLPYYGAETFGLHALGRAYLGGDTDVLRLVGEIRDQPVALTTFALGLGLLALGAVLAALAWQRATNSRAGWPLAVLVALLLPQFFLPPVGRVAFGVGYALAAGWWAVDSVRRSPGRGQ